MNSFSSKLKLDQILPEDLISHSTYNIFMHHPFESCELGAANKCHKVKGAKYGEQKIMKPQVLQVKGDEHETLQMKACQLPLLITGHQLQGSGVDSLFVHNWSYVQNWVYVMLSRVKTRAGLFLRKPLSYDLTKYAVPEALQRMLHQFRSTKSPTYWTDEQYNDVFDLN